MTKTVLITGSTDGIGLLTAELLIKEGHKVLLHGRSAEKLSAAAESLANPPAYLADLSRPNDVKKLADEVAAEHQTIDVLINNAGVYKTPHTRTAEHHDTRIAVTT